MMLTTSSPSFCLLTGLMPQVGLRDLCAALFKEDLGLEPRGLNRRWGLVVSYDTPAMMGYYGYIHGLNGYQV